MFRKAALLLDAAAQLANAVRSRDPIALLRALSVLGVKLEDFLQKNPEWKEDLRVALQDAADRVTFVAGKVTTVAGDAVSRANEAVCSHPKTTAAVFGGAALPLLVPAAVGVAGFSAAGVVAGSPAALYQSSVLAGVITKGSAYALLQSAGALGFSTTATATMAVAGAAGGAGVARVAGN